MACRTLHVLERRQRWEGSMDPRHQGSGQRNLLVQYWYLKHRESSKHRTQPRVPGQRMARWNYSLFIQVSSPTNHAPPSVAEKRQQRKAEILEPSSWVQSLWWRYYVPLHPDALLGSWIRTWKCFARDTLWCSLLRWGNPFTMYMYINEHVYALNIWQLYLSIILNKT